MDSTGPTQIANRMRREATEIENDLQRGGVATGDYAFAYGRLKAVVERAARDTASLDPATDLEVMTYEEIISREA